MKMGQISTIDTQMLGFWVVMNIINGIARGGSPCELPPPSLDPDERMLWERNTYVRRWNVLNVYCRERIQSLRLRVPVSITVTAFMQPMPILTPPRNKVGAGLEPIQTCLLLERQTSGRGGHFGPSHILV